MTKITDTEANALQGIIDSEFRDGDNPVGCMVWTWSANPFPSKRTFSGAMSSLVKKGMAGSTAEGKDSCVWLTQSGFDALNEYNKAMAA